VHDEQGPNRHSSADLQGGLFEIKVVELVPQEWAFHQPKDREDPMVLTEVKFNRGIWTS